MTPEEIVKALKQSCNGCDYHENPSGCCVFEVLGQEAADLIAALQEHEEMFKAYRHVCGGKSPEEIASLTARAERAEAELKEAVEDIKKYRGKKCDGCYYAGKSGEFVPCRDCQSPISNCGDKWKWRGAREGTR